jgi:hypothetical protein
MGNSLDLEIEQENKNIRRLRFMVDLTCILLNQTRLSREESWEMVEGVKQYALRLFPGKEEAFEIIYRPRLRRIIEARYPLH